MDCPPQDTSLTHPFRAKNAFPHGGEKQPFLLKKWKKTLLEIDFSQ
jgi:hypothetical protein